MAKAKICGLSATEDVAAALEGGADFVGFVFFKGSPRQVTPQAAARLAQPVRGRARIVAVTADPDDGLIETLRHILRPDLIQLHGAETPTRARQIANRAGAGVIKAIPVREIGDLDAAAAYETVSEHLMFDARPPRHADRPGGSGMSFDWSMLSGRRFRKPWFLAGGLDPWNVEAALAASGAPMADVSSGVERGAGLKDPALIRAFLEAVRRV
ncbi:MAG: phosphoribosylanthranilate isomerase [Caulobacteraceae bacterium]